MVETSTPGADRFLAARDEWSVVGGAIRYWPLRSGESGAPALLLVPGAGHPTRQGEGLGALLIMETLSRARIIGWERVVLVGDEPYYRRFGFTRQAAERLSFPPPTNPDRVLARELVPDAFADVSGMIRRWTD